MNREVQVRFCERFRGEIPLYLLDLFFYYLGKDFVLEISATILVEEWGLYRHTEFFKVTSPSKWTMVVSVIWHCFFCYG
jgi:hypothetical protein